MSELNDDYELPSTFYPYFAFFTSNELSKSIKPNIYIDYPYTQDFHLRHPSTLNIKDSFLSYDDNTVTVEDIEKNGTFIGELNEKAINILLSHSDDIEKVVKYKLLTMDEFKKTKAQDEKWISENVDNQDIDEALFNSKMSKVDQIDNLIEDIYNLRKEGMEEDGEYSIKNLIFKEFRNLGYLDNLKELRKKEISKELSLEQLQECSLLESKQDINAFIDKFGQDTYDEFKKSSQRLKNNGYSTDIIKYTKDDS